jgi:UDP-N-acetylmuramoyl-L-alanyl-D-glutamate--2,6-diaminopimelate ligase
LDFHPDLEDYFQSKKLLFTEYAEFSAEAGKKPVSVVLEDSEHGRRLARELGGDVGVGLSDAQNLKISREGVEFGFGDLRLRSPLVGEFNVANLLGAAALALKLGVPRPQIEKGISDLQVVPGRLEQVQAGPHVPVQVLVDYAHKPDALEKVLQCLRPLVPAGAGRLITVFGCGGDRDRTKRPVMGEIATRISDFVYITSDNPRTEDPDAIIREIVGGITRGNFVVQADRKAAIDQAIGESRPGDLILIAGKGHEDYQILGTRKIHFDDKEIAFEALTRVFKNL